MKYLLIAPLVLSACGTVAPVCEPDHYPYSCERSREIDKGENKGTVNPDREPVHEQDEAKHDAWEDRQKRHDKRMPKGRRQTMPVSEECLDEVERLAKDCELASECLRDTNTFETGQAILTEAASMLRALARLRTERKEK